jgi:hypothetical protein
MAQIRGTAGYNLNQNFGGPSKDVNDPSPLDAIRSYTDKVEEALDTISEPVKPYLTPFLFLSQPRHGSTEAGEKALLFSHLRLTLSVSNSC